MHTTSGSGMEIQHVGHGILRSPARNLQLKNILHVPTAHKDLLSVNRLARDNHVFFEFHPDHFCVKEQATRKTLLTGPCRRGLYPVRPANKEVLSAHKLPASLWHHRLGHPASSVVQRVLHHHKIPFIQESNKTSICDACQKGKSHQLPYPRSSSVSSSVLDLIFSDVWGSPPSSVGRNNYYVSFIDDHSKFTWIYLLRRKSEVFQCFREFQALVERQFDRKIRTIQTDWGGEYQALSSFFSRMGISHHVSCPHAHQQNGSAERKHRHIVEVGLTLLAHASMPLKFWDEAFLTAVYLINRLPTKVLQNDTPHFRLFGEHPNYEFLRSFGCACWPNMRPYNTRKLAFRSTKCVFLGYSNKHKGYKCLDPSAGRVYISRDVVFDENIFPFASLHPNAGAQLRAEIALLPDMLRNPSAGDSILPDQNTGSSLPTNPSQDCARDLMHTGANSESTEQESAAGDRYFMCRNLADSTDPRADSPTSAVRGSGRTGGSASGRASSPSRLTVSGAPSAGSSAAPSVPHVSESAQLAPQPDRDAGSAGDLCAWIVYGAIPCC